MPAGTMPAADARAFNWVIGVKDMASKPLKQVGTTWNKVASSATRESKKFKSQIKNMGSSLKRMAKDLQSTGKQLMSFGGIVKNVAAMFGVGVLAFGLIAAVKKTIQVLFAFQMSLDTLIPAVSATGNALEGLSSDMMYLSTVTGENFETTAAWVAQLAEIKPYGKDFRSFATDVLTVADATGQSREAVGGLFVRLEQLTGQKFEVRRLGDAMKYWADQSSLTNGEIMGLAGSFDDLLLRMPGQKGEELTSRLMGLGVAFEKAGGKATDVSGILTDLMDVENTQQRAFLARAGMSGAEITAAFEQGQPEEIFRALVTAAGTVDAKMLATMPKLAERITGFSASTVKALSQVKLSDISKDALDAAIKSKAATDAFMKRQANIERRWARMKQRFIVMITRITKPLLDLLDKVMKPLEKILNSIAKSAEKAIKKLTAPMKPGETIFGRMKDAAIDFWDELKSNKQINSFVEAFKETMKKTAKWLGKNILAPAIAFGWNDLVRGNALLGNLIIDTSRWDGGAEQRTRDVGNFKKVYRSLALNSTFSDERAYEMLQKMYGSGGKTYAKSLMDEGPMSAGLMNLYTKDEEAFTARFVKRLAFMVGEGKPGELFADEFAGLAQLPEEIRERQNLIQFYEALTYARSAGMFNQAYGTSGRVGSDAALPDLEDVRKR